MNTIILNEVSFPISSFSRNTYFNEGTMNSHGFITLGTDFNVSALFNLAKAPITSLQIKHDNEIIYSLTDVNITITSIDENLTSETINATINLQFN